MINPNPNFLFLLSSEGRVVITSFVSVSFDSIRLCTYCKKLEFASTLRLDDEINHSQHLLG